MRIVFVWVTTFILLFTVSIGWYLSLPVTIGLMRSLQTVVTDPTALGIARIVEFVGIIWGPLWDLFILLWAVISSQRRDVESMVYG